MSRRRVRSPAYRARRLIRRATRNLIRKTARIAADTKRYPLDPVGYAERVRELEHEGLTTSDAQGVADVEFARKAVQS